MQCGNQNKAYGIQKTKCLLFFEVPSKGKFYAFIYGCTQTRLYIPNILYNSFIGTNKVSLYSEVMAKVEKFFIMAKVIQLFSFVLYPYMDFSECVPNKLFFQEQGSRPSFPCVLGMHVQKMQNFPAFCRCVNVSIPYKCNEIGTAIYV